MFGKNWQVSAIALSFRQKIQTRKRRRPQFPVAFDVCWSLLATLAAMVANFPENVAHRTAHGTPFLMRFNGYR